MSSPSDAELARQWLPSDLLDEMVPPLRPSPSDWIAACADGSLALDDDNGDDEACANLTDGQRVAFHWMVELGTATLTIAPDRGAPTVSRLPTAPPGSHLNLWAHCDPESICDTVGDLADWLEDPGDYEIGFYAWSDRGESFQFNLAERAFVPVPHG